LPHIRQKTRQHPGQTRVSAIFLSRYSSMKPMNLKVWCAILALLAALAVAWKVLEPEEVVAAAVIQPQPRHPNEKPRAIPKSSVPKLFQPVPILENSQVEPRVLEISKTHPRYLDWSLDELESYLEEQKSVLTSSEMFARLAYILPDPVGSKPGLNRLLPGSISVADQARLCLKYADSEDHMALFSGFWARCRDAASGYPDYEFLGEVTSVLEPGHLRNTMVRQQVFHCFSDYERMLELFGSEDPINGIFPNFVIMAGDEKHIVDGLNASFKKIAEMKQADKSELSELVLNSNIEKVVQSKMIEYITNSVR